MIAPSPSVGLIPPELQLLRIGSEADIAEGKTALPLRLVPCEHKKRPDTHCASGLRKIVSGRLPAGLGHPWDESVGSKLTESDPGKLEAANVSAATTSDEATISEPGRAGVTGKHGEGDVVLLLLEFPAQRRVFCYRLLFALIALNPALLCHGLFVGVESLPAILWLSRGKTSPAQVFSGNLKPSRHGYVHVVWTYLCRHLSHSRRSLLRLPAKGLDRGF